MTINRKGPESTPAKPVNPVVNPLPQLRVPFGMSLENYITNRLDKWVIWRFWLEGLLTNSPGPKRVSSWWGPLWSVRRQNNSLPSRAFMTCPVDVEEAEETDRCVQVLMHEDKTRGVKYHGVIVLCYLTNFTKVQKAATMTPPGDPVTYYRRLARAHSELLCIMNDVQAGLIEFPLPERHGTPVARQHPERLDLIVNPVPKINALTPMQLRI